MRGKMRRNSENDWLGNKPLHFDRLRWGKGEKGSRGEMQRMRAKPEIPVVVGMVVGEGSWA
jgi:hypothetical protein